MPKAKTVKKPLPTKEQSGIISGLLREHSEALQVLALRTVNMAQIPAAWKAVGQMEGTLKTLSDQVFQFYALYERQNKQMDEMIRIMREMVKSRSAVPTLMPGPQPQ